MPHALRSNCRKLGYALDADLGSDRMNAKIRAAQLMKIPYMLVVGDQEVADHTVSLRRRDGTRMNNLHFGAFLEIVKEKIERRAGDL